MDEAARARAEARRADQAAWPVRVYRLLDEPARDPLDRSSVEDRLAMMWGLAQEAWAVAGLPIPDYRRADAPGQMFRGPR